MKTSASGGESPLLADDSLAHPAASWILLTRLPGFGIRVRQSVLQAVDNLCDVLSLSSATLKAIGLDGETLTGILAWQHQDSNHPLMVEVAGIVDACNSANITILTWPDRDYPEALRHIHNPPLALYCLGDTALLRRDQIGIVGSRHATPAGLDHARRFAMTLSERGLLVTSGLALGIDGAAHAGALDAGAPTVAVIGSGPDRLYPRQHLPLGRRIAERGVIVSEYPPGTPARAGHFPKRNRIISGLSRGILVVEAGLKSGSLISARLALEQGREVFAIPGSVHSPVARGCHHLIKQGARLVETVDDVLEELGTWWSLQPAMTEKPEAAGGPDLSALAEREIAVFRALGYDPLSTDALASATGLPADQLMQSLLLLELQGLVASAPGGYLRLA